MKILVLSQYFFPETFRINDIVRELVKRGNSVTVLTGLPNYPEGEIYEGYEKAYQTVTYYNGAKIYRCKLRPRHKGTKNLALNYYSFVREASKTLKCIKPEFDLIFFYEPSPIFAGIPAIKYGKKHHIKTVIYNMDIWPDCVRDSRCGSVMSKKNPIYLVSKALSNYIYKRFDLIINKCDGFADYLSNELHLSKEKMQTIHEHAENTYLSVDPYPIENGIIDFMFLGNIGKTQNCDQIVYAYSKVCSEKTMLHFVGDGSYLKHLKENVVKLGLSQNVIFHGKKTVDETIDYYNLADVCLLTLSNKTASGLTPPGKLFSYMAASRPIIASINGDSKNIIETANCGLTCFADDLNGLITLMHNAIDGSFNLQEMGKNGRSFFLKHFTLETFVNRLCSSFESLIRDDLTNHKEKMRGER